MDWTEVTDGLLIRVWNDGGSLAKVAQAVAEATGTEVSRSAISGRKGRLIELGYQLEVRDTPAGLKPPPPKGKRAPRHKTRPAPQKPRQPVAPIMQKPAAPVQHDDGVEYSRLGLHGCKSLLDKRGGDGFWMCCGKKQRDGSVYCADHHARYHDKHKERF